MGKILGFVFLMWLAGGSAGSAETVQQAESDLVLRNWVPALWDSARSVSGHARSEGIVAMALPSAASHFIALNPCRVVDTRRPSGAHGGPILAGAVPRSFNVTTGPCPGIPAAAAYSVNIAVTGSAPSSGQFLTAWPTGTTRPVIATMNFNGGATVSNAAIVPAEGGSIDIYASASTHVIIDINGYMMEGVVSSVTPGTGLTGGGTGSITLGIANGAIDKDQLAPSAVGTGAIADGAVSGAKIANGQVVRDLNGLKDSISLVGAGGTSVSTIGSTITIDAQAGAPSGSITLGDPNDTTLIGAGYTEIAATREDYWQPISSTGAPSARAGHASVWTGSRMIVWGGHDGISFFGDGAAYDPVTDSWSSMTMTGAPSPRVPAAWIWTGSRMVLWGGYDGTGLNTGARYDPVEDAWTPVTVTGAPSGRAYSTAVWTGTKMIVWGGADTDGYINTGAQYDPAANSWSATSVAGAPSPRFNHTAIWTGTKMIVWGGFDGTTRFNTGAQYEPEGNVWTATPTTGAPLGRERHSAIWTGTRMIVWGGSGFSGHHASGAQFNPGTNSWSETSMIGAPEARQHHTAAWTGSRMIIWGGEGFDGDFRSGGVYDPIQDEWVLSTTLMGAPSGRGFNAGIWTGSKLLIWGGTSGGVALNSGGRWTLLSLYRKN